MNDIKVDQELDCRGMGCPLPVLKTKKAVAGMQSGQVLKMITTDAGSNKDMPSWSERTGNEIIKTEEAGGEYIFWVKVK